MSTKEHPALFNGEMVRRILAGEKTQTRRPIKPQPTQLHKLPRCPFGQPGDRLWVRETFWSENEECDHEMCGGCDFGHTLSSEPGSCYIDYCATPRCSTPPQLKNQQTFEPYTGPAEPGWWEVAPPKKRNGDYDLESTIDTSGDWGFVPWRYWTKHPSIHMPRWASRITLLVKRVWVEQVQAITMTDARAEGICHHDARLVPGVGLVRQGWFEPGRDFPHNAPEHAFHSLWNSIYKKQGLGWNENPWVWCCEFEVVEVKS